MSKPPLERAARALCALDGNPENAMMEGKPLWQSYLPEARAVIQTISDPLYVAIADQLSLANGADLQAKAFNRGVYAAGAAAKAMIDEMLANG